MRRILVEPPASGGGETRRGGGLRIALDEAIVSGERRDVDLLALDDALTGLTALDSTQCRIVELRYSSPASPSKRTAEALDSSPRHGEARMDHRPGVAAPGDDPAMSERWSRVKQLFYRSHGASVSGRARPSRERVRRGRGAARRGGDAARGPTSRRRRAFLGSTAMRRRASRRRWESASGPWQIVEEIGAGGMGAVYRAARVDEEFEKQVAIKLIRRGMNSDFIVARFRAERADAGGPRPPQHRPSCCSTAAPPPAACRTSCWSSSTAWPIDQFCRELPVAKKLEIFLAVCGARRAPRTRAWSCTET